MSVRKIAKKEPAPLKQTTAEKWPLNIDPDIHAAWVLLRERNDLNLLVEQTGFTKPTVLKAVKHGHCKNKELEDLINTFYVKRHNERAKKEHETGTIKTLKSIVSHYKLS